MAQKRIKMVRQDILGDRLRLLYDDGTQGVLDLSLIHICHIET